MIPQNVSLGKGKNRFFVLTKLVVSDRLLQSEIGVSQPYKLQNPYSINLFYSLFQGSTRRQVILNLTNKARDS